MFYANENNVSDNNAWELAKPICLTVSPTLPLNIANALPMRLLFFSFQIFNLKKVFKTQINDNDDAMQIDSRETTTSSTSQEAARKKSSKVKPSRSAGKLDETGKKNFQIHLNVNSIGGGCGRVSITM